MGSKISPTRADEGSDKQKMRRDEKVRAIEKKGQGLEPRKSSFLGDLHVPWFRADTPIGRLKGPQLTDNRAIEKGVEKTELITKGGSIGRLTNTSEASSSKLSRG